MIYIIYSILKGLPSKFLSGMILQAVYISADGSISAGDLAPMSMFKWMLMDVSRCLTICFSICFLGVELWQLYIDLDLSRCLWILMVCIPIDISWALYLKGGLFLSVSETWVQCRPQCHDAKSERLRIESRVDSPGFEDI